MFFAFINRTRFSYRLGDIFDYLFKCLCIRSAAANRDDAAIKKHFLFEKAASKFMGELDVIRIVRTLRKFKMLSQAMLS